MLSKSISDFDSGHCLRARRAFRTTRSKMKNSFSVSSEPTFNEDINRIDFHPLSAPAEETVWRRITATNYVHPETLLSRRAQKMGG
jgi:hypothetical protein